jgi:DNA-binding MurR/RpiR family transcriptional regulator
MNDLMPAVPESFDLLRAAISARHDGLSKRLKVIAEYALRHPNDMALETIAVIAERARVQPSSLIRFAKAFGYDGFSDMQQVFRSRFLDRTPSYHDRIEALTAGAGKLDGTGAALHAFTEAGIQALHDLDSPANAERLDAAVRALAAADTIHLLAQRRSYPIAAYLQYALSHLDRRTHILDGVGGMLFEQARAVRRGDVLVAVSYRDYAPDVVEIVRTAHADGVAIVAITDGPLSPLLPLSGVCFEIEEAHVQTFRSLTATMCLALTLVVSLGQHLKTRTGSRRGEARKPAA